MADFYDAGTGELIPQDQVADAIASGRATIDPGASIILKDSTGSRIELTGEDAASNLAQHLSQGYSIESDAERAALDQELAARDAPIQAGAEALAQGASLGLYGAAAGQLSPEYAQGMVARRDALGGYGDALEIGGAVLPTFFSGGAFTPAGLLARGTEATGKALEHSLMRRGVGEGVAKIAGMGAEGLVDGAVVGATQQLSEDSLGGHEITAERLAAAGGLGALLGFGGGAALGSVAAVGRKGARGIADRIAAREARAANGALGETVERIGAKDAGLFEYVPDSLVEKYIRTSAAATGADERALREAFGDANIRSDWLQQDKVREVHNKNLREAIQGTSDFDPTVRSIAAGEIKASTVRRDIKQGAEAAAQAQRQAQPIFLDIDTKLAQLAPDLGNKEYKALRRDLNDVEVQIHKAVENGDNHHLYLTLENYKRAFDSIVDKGPRSTGSQLDRRNFQEIFDMSRSSGDKIRKLLENEDLFGEIARKQRERNSALRQVIESGYGFNDALMRKTGESANAEQWWLDKRIADGDKTQSFLNDLNNPIRDQKVQVVQEHFEALDRLYDTLKNNDEIPDAKLADFERAQVGVKRSLEILKTASDQLGKIGGLNAIEKMGRETSGLLAPTALATVGGFAGGGIGAGLGAAAGGLFGLVSKPGGILRQAAQLEAIHRRAVGVSQSVRTKTQSAVRHLAVPKARRVGKAGVRASVLLFGSDRESQRSNARKVEKRLTEMRQDPQRVVDAIGYQTATIASVAPRTTLALTAQTTRAASFLESKLPAPSANPYKLQPQLNTSQWTDEQVDKFSRYAATIKDPLSALDDLKSGKLSPESVEALQAVYPRIYDEMRQAAMEEVAVHGDEMPYDSVLQLSMLLGFEGHPTLDPAFIKTIQDAWANPPKPEAVGPSPSNTKPISFQRSEVDRLMGGLQP